MFNDSPKAGARTISTSYINDGSHTPSHFVGAAVAQHVQKQPQIIPTVFFARLGQKIVQEGWAEAVALLETEQTTFEATWTSHARKQHQLRAHLDM